MSKTEDNPAEPAKPKKKKLLKLAMAVLVLGGAGAGGAYYANGAGLIHVPGLAAGGEPDLPHLVARDGVHPTNFAVRGGKPVDPSQFKASYYPLAENFTSNLADGGGFVQVALGVSTYYDERVLQNVQQNEMAVRSAVLMTLAGRDAAGLATPEGKTRLKADLAKAINAELTAKAGFGGIDDVHFTSFVMQ